MLGERRYSILCSLGLERWAPARDLSELKVGSLLYFMKALTSAAIPSALVSSAKCPASST